ncbi:argonaute/ago1/eukaryotic translation initiation factor 2c [Blumeria hordei DH14]|uniref:Argonaute/ago1/eukaryotic translation initiation factor 2c n=1 Tax=Blumeria graminis f. sp. hordei (strain DH14) TaxID=546991 RepID=N1J8L8_BLUG1|nr:argonaute/ago1/eukaryotic translation initiation factor 2c [Blumeria hordei DH14]
MMTNQIARVITNSRMELPPDAYRVEPDVRANIDFKSNWSQELPSRPGFNTTGKAISILLNQHRVTQWTQNDIYQYDVINIGSGAEKLGKIKAVWMSRQVQEKILQINRGFPLIWDGNKIAWSSNKLPEQRMTVDLDAEKGRAARPGKSPDTCYVIIRLSKTIRMASIKAYIEKKITFDNTVLESINFLDHVMRQGPSEYYTQIKRSYFSQGNVSQKLDDVVYAMKGVYSSMRLCNTGSMGTNLATGLGVNVDVANGTFWISQDMHQAARNLCKERNRQLQWNVFRDLLQPIRDPKSGKWKKSEDWKTLQKMSKLRFTVKHRKSNGKRIGFTFAESQGGAHSKNMFFSMKDRKCNPPREEKISVFDYFKKTYNITIQYWDLPLVITSRDGMFPMELCVIAPSQRYNFKMTPEQTSAMIKFAVSRPKDRTIAIKHGISMLKWDQDKYLNHFGIKIDPNMTQTQARLLPAPDVAFGAGSKVSPGTAGRWDLRGKKFIVPNPEPLKSWGICVLASCCPEATVRNFLNTFIQVYTSHGGRIENKNPVIYFQVRTETLPDAVANVRNAAGNQAKQVPQILFYVIPSRDSFQYERLKKNNEIRFTTVSQCMNVAHVQKAQPQYCSNIAMKVNAKLGGTTAKAIFPGIPRIFSSPTLVIGADVSHPSPGSPQASMAAITVSMDADACRYAAAVQTNGRRVEIIGRNTIENQMLPLVNQWVKNVGQGKLPTQIYYFRDGISEGQYSHVLKNEVDVMKEMLEKKFGSMAKQIKWTVTVCSKRHHLRFFPKEGDRQAADRNNNSFPGTLVERDITHPFEYDFYLNSHSAIQGTARPVHYHVIRDEAKCPPNDFQRLLYGMCYQYIRSTTPVSLVPAVYYAHLASNRARAHEDVFASEGPRGGQKFEELRQDAANQAPTSITGSSQLLEEVRPLAPMGTTDNLESMIKIRTGMWYI